MRFIYNAKLAVKFLGSFFILIVAMIFIGVLGVINMGQISAANSSIYENNFTATTYIEDIKSNINEVRMYTQMMINEDQAANLESNISSLNATADKTTADMEEYRKHLTEDGGDTAMFHALEASLADYRSAREEIIVLTREGKFTEAYEYNATFVIPLVQAAQSDIEELIEYNMSAAEQSVADALANYESSTVITFIIIGVMTLVAVIIGIFMSTIISRALNALREVSAKIADGDLTVVLPERYLQQKDEVGILANNIKAMQEGLINTVSGIKDSAGNLGEAVNSATDILNTLNDRITDASAATEELSAGMEETGASAQEMNATASEIERAVETVAEKAEDGAGKSGEIHKRASELGKHVNGSIEKSNDIFSQIKTALEKALEDSKAVNEINALADAILGITSQTTLLALNASIEAARAGEAGRGFAVVANEISALADNSKNTVTQIQAITKVVMSAVGDLANSSTNLLNFVANEVMNDYKDMLEAADSYTTDATFISDMTSDLSATSEELLASLQILMRAINEVSAAAQEGAKTTSVVAEQTTDISVGASGVVENIKEARSTANQLVGLVDKFKL